MALALLLGLVGACGDGAGAARQDALLELERLAFVPAGQVHVGAFVPVVLYENPQALLVEVFEATRGEFRRFAAAEPDSLGAAMLARVRSWPPDQDDLPAAYMTQPEAARFAAWRGRRLLRAGEWLYCTLGPERRPFPWVGERQDSIANTLDLGLGRPCPVGTFEGGRSPREVYDLLGNVAEWIAADVLVGSTRPASADEEAADRPVSAMGGSFRTWLRPIYRPPRAGDPLESAYLAYRLHPLSRQDDVGLRCAAPAREALQRIALELGRDARTRSRLVAVGARWGRPAVPLLSELAALPGAPPGLAALLEGAQR